MESSKELPGQLKAFVETLKRHPFRMGVSKPEPELEDFQYLQEYSHHWQDCFHGGCMGYHTALMGVYLRSLSETQLGEFFRELIECDWFGYSILRFICLFVFREKAHLEMVKVDEYRDLNTHGGSSVFIRGEVLAKNTKGTRLVIQHFTFRGEGFIVPYVWPKETGKYLTNAQVYDILMEEAIKAKGEKGYEFVKRLEKPRSPET